MLTTFFLMRRTFLIILATVVLTGIGNMVQAQSFIVTGQVKDGITGESIPFVNVVEVDNNGRFVAGTTTDDNGNYVIRVSSSTAKIMVSFIGYAKNTLDINGQSVIDFILMPDMQMVDEVVVTAERISNDGVTAVRDRGVAVSRIEMKELEGVRTTNIEEMLQGRIGNVDISAVSGDPGAGLNIRIRGTATLNARNNPLIVVNGIPYDANLEGFDFSTADVERFGSLIDVAPEDIETIEVLKDAASTAIWGSKAANGVLMIKTKRGIKSKPIFDYSYKITQAREPRQIPMLDGGGYARLITDQHFNVNRGQFSHNEIAFDPSWPQYHNFSQNTNWIDQITQIAHINQHNFSVRGGGDKSRYNLSMSYNDEEGTTIGNDLRRLTLRNSLDYDLSTKLRFNSDILYTHYDQTSNFWDNVREIAYQKMPNMSVFERDTLNNLSDIYFTPFSTLQGSSSWMYNPLAFADLAYLDRIRNNTRASVNLRYLPFEKLEISTTITLDIFDEKVERFLPYKALGFSFDSHLTNQANNAFNKKSSVFSFTRAIYRPVENDVHSVIIVSQFDTEQSVNRSFGVTTSRAPSPVLQIPVGDKTLNSFYSGLSEFRSMGYFLNANYKLLDRYILTAGAKYEGNSRFSPETRWGLFPTVSLAWRASEELFMQWAGFLDDLRFRGSWGQTGNMPDQNYLYFNTYTAGAHLAYLDMPGVQPSGPELTSLRWETIDQKNLGISLSAFNSRLNIEADVYRKTTNDLYLPYYNIPWHSGYTNIKINDGEMVNQGWELMADFQVINNRDFELAFNFNTSHNQNIVIRLPENYSLEYGNMLENGNYRISIVPGQPLGGFFGYMFLGVYSTDEDAIVYGSDGQPVYALNRNEPMSMIHGGPAGYQFMGGDAIYADINYDGVIDERDLVYLGDLNPDLMGGFNLRTRYKALTLNVFFNYKVGQKIINQTRMNTEKMYGYENQSIATNWRWRRQGDETIVPRALFGQGYNWMGSDRFVEDGSFLRLRTASVSYMLPAGLTKRLGVKDMRVYAMGYNLFTWTKYTGQDPDVPIPSNPSELPKDYSRTPPSFRITLGTNITF
jgi:TonB-linked SusC/RagA family outer membrane protein